jgi:hypothetical protein
MVFTIAITIVAIFAIWGAVAPDTIEDNVLIGPKVNLITINHPLEISVEQKRNSCLCNLFLFSFSSVSLTLEADCVW